MTRIALLSTSDTDLLCARGSGADYLLANPSRPGHTSRAEAIEAADIVVARILGGPQAVQPARGVAQGLHHRVPAVEHGGSVGAGLVSGSAASVPPGTRRKGPVSGP